MKEITKHKAELIGQKLIKVYHSDQGEGIEHLNGLGLAYYFSTVLELDTGKKYIFDNNSIDEWDGSEKLFEVTHMNWGIRKNILFNGLKIINIIIDEHQDLYIQLENDTLIYHTINYGDQLFIEKYSYLFDTKGKLKKENYQTNQKQTSLWKRLKSIFNL